MVAINIGKLNLDFLRPEFLWGVFALILILFAVISMILVYHWVSFTHKKKTIIFFGTMYFGVSFTIIALFALSLSLYIHSL